MDIQRTGRIFGWLFIGTFITSIPARLLFVHGIGANWTDMHFVPGATSNTSLKLGAILEFGLIVTQIGTAVVIYPLVRRQSETVSLGYVTARVMESVFAAIIVSFLLTLSGAYDNGSPVSGLLALPEIVWEAFLGIYCAWKGFRPESPIAAPSVALAYS